MMKSVVNIQLYDRPEISLNIYGGRFMEIYDISGFLEDRILRKYSKQHGNMQRKQ